jgi:hypothetical protein
MIFKLRKNNHTMTFNTILFIVRHSIELLTNFNKYKTKQQILDFYIEKAEFKMQKWQTATALLKAIKVSFEVGEYK